MVNSRVNKCTDMSVRLCNTDPGANRKLCNWFTVSALVNRLLTQELLSVEAECQIKLSLQFFYWSVLSGSFIRLFLSNKISKYFFLQVYVKTVKIGGKPKQLYRWECRSPTLGHPNPVAVRNKTSSAVALRLTHSRAVNNKPGFLHLLLSPLHTSPFPRCRRRAWQAM